MTKIYTKLPDEMQKKITFYVRENYLIKKHHHDVICKILNNKFDEKWFVHIVYCLNMPNMNKNVTIPTLNIITHLYYLYTKYSKIVPFRILHRLYTCRYDLKYLKNQDIVEHIQQYHYIQQYLDSLLKLETAIYHFEKEYFICCY